MQVRFFAAAIAAMWCARSAHKHVKGPVRSHKGAAHNTSNTRNHTAFTFSDGFAATASCRCGSQHRTCRDVCPQHPSAQHPFTGCRQHTAPAFAAASDQGGQSIKYLAPEPQPGIQQIAPGIGTTRLAQDKTSPNFGKPVEGQTKSRGNL
jgi:hypothetical protein